MWAEHQITLSRIPGNSEGMGSLQLPEASLVRVGQAGQTDLSRMLQGMWVHCRGLALAGVIVVTGDGVGVSKVENKAMQTQGMDAKF